MIGKIIYDAQYAQRTIAELKKVAPLYPNIFYFEDAKGTLWATCMVITEREGIKFKRHIVEYIIPNDKVKLEHLSKRICRSAELNIEYGKYHPNLDDLI